MRNNFSLIYKVELIKGASALKYGSEGVGGMIYFKDNPFIQSKGSGFISSKFDNSNYLPLFFINLPLHLNINI